ncbi:MAG: sigma-70 family RNA polymerase sigma factor [Muribaculaceae bacterium]|nr:sigma-70 family RNA polymerase sigma factor [Muribaculaceae bacterium]
MITLTTTKTSSSIWRVLTEMVMLFAESLGVTSESRRIEHIFKQTIQNHDAMIRRICLGYAANAQDLEDLYQDVLVNIWRGMPSFRSESSIRTWVYRIALNTCVSTLRARSNRPSQSSLEDVILVADDSIEKRESIKDLYECIATLNPIDKAILMMWLDEYSYDEIAETIGLKRNNIATRLHRAKEKLRQKYL